jgi:hypothetical protein
MHFECGPCRPRPSFSSSCSETSQIEDEDEDEDENEEEEGAQGARTSPKAAGPQTDGAPAEAWDSDSGRSD